jgi:ATP-dependent DNA ligase
MECALVPTLPEGSDWTYEVKLDGYRAIGVRTSNETILYSRNHKNFNKRFPQIAEALRNLPADSVIDGEVVALDESGRPDFHRLQHFTAEASRIRYFVFDLIILRGRDLTSLPLSDWTEGDRLRHSNFVALRDDKNPREVVKEALEAAEPDDL